MVKKPVVGSDLPDPPDNERLTWDTDPKDLNGLELHLFPLTIEYLDNGFWSVETAIGPAMTEAGDGLCTHEVSQLLSQGTITQCDTCGVDA